MVVNTFLFTYSFSFIPFLHDCTWTAFTVVPFSIEQSNVNKFWSNRKSGAGAARGGPGNRKLTNRGGTLRCPLSPPLPRFDSPRYFRNEPETIFYCLFGLG